MESTFIYIKNMVCDRCIMAVRSLLQEMGLEPLSVRLGEAELSRPLSAAGRASLDAALRRLGFELIDGRRERLAEQVKTLVIELVHRENGCLRVNLSDYLAERLRHDYDYISGIFSDVEGTTVEKFFIAQKIERVKELLAYDEFSLSEIAGMLNYSSVAHLSAQFKRVTDSRRAPTSGPGVPDDSRWTRCEACGLFGRRMRRCARCPRPTGCMSIRIL